MRVANCNQWRELPFHMTLDTLYTQYIHILPNITLCSIFIYQIMNYRIKRTLATTVLLVDIVEYNYFYVFTSWFASANKHVFLRIFWSVITHLEKNYYVLICDPIFWNICVKTAHKRKKIGNDKRSMTIDFFVEA